jgi:hypothetical protein
MQDFAISSRGHNLFTGIIEDLASLEIAECKEMASLTLFPMSAPILEMMGATPEVERVILRVEKDGPIAFLSSLPPPPSHFGSCRRALLGP